MALTAEQKEANRLARNERDRAHRARRKLRDAAEKAAKDAILVEFGPQHEEPCAAENEVEAEREAFRADIAQRMAALRQEEDAAMAVFRDRWRAAHDVASAIWDRKMAAEKAADRRLDEQFPDLVGAARWSAACWTPPTSEVPTPAQPALSSEE